MIRRDSHSVSVRRRSKHEAARQKMTDGYLEIRQL